MEKRFIVTTKDNKTGKTETHETNSLFLVMGVEDGAVRLIGLECNGLETAELLESVDELLAAAKDKYPLEWWFVKMTREKEGEEDE